MGCQQAAVGVASAQRTDLWHMHQRDRGEMHCTFMAAEPSAHSEDILGPAQIVELLLTHACRKATSHRHS